MTSERTGRVSALIQSSVDVGVQSTLVLGENKDRRAALFINDSDAVVYLSQGEPAVMNIGIRLNPGGGAFELTLEYGNLYCGEIYAIQNAGGLQKLLVTEGV